MWSGDHGGCARCGATLVLVVAVRAPPGVDDLLVVFHHVHVVERGDDGRDGPQEGRRQLEEDPPEAEEVPYPEDAPERTVPAERGVAPVEEPVDRRGVLERRLDLLPLAGRPADASHEVRVHVLEQRTLEAASRVVGEVDLASRGDRHHASRRGEGEPQHRQQRAACAARPQKVPGEHRHRHQVERQTDSRPGEASRPRLLEVDRLLLELARARSVRPGGGPVRVVVDLTTTDPRPSPENEFEAGAAQNDDADQEPDPVDLVPSQHLLGEDQVQQVADPGEGRVAPESQVRQPVHRWQAVDFSQRCCEQRLSPFRRCQMNGKYRHKYQLYHFTII